MIARMGAASIVLACLVALPGCSRLSKPAGEPGDPAAAEVLVTHWRALKQGEWQAAYDTVHPDLKSGKATFKAFTDRNMKRRKAKALPEDIRIARSERQGDTTLVSFDLLVVPPGGGALVPAPPLRQAILRKNGAAWKLATLDILAVGPASAGNAPVP